MSCTARATVLTLAVLFPLAACGENGPEVGTAGEPAAAAVPAGAQPITGPITVSITEKACELSTQVAFAGANVLHVTNHAAATAEVYVYDGSRVVTEREGIEPGAKAEITFEADAGSLQVACKPADADLRTALELTPAGGTGGQSDAQAKAVADYRAYVQGQADELVPLVEAFTAAVKAGDVAKAKSLYTGSRVPWEAIEPVAESFGDLDPAVDLREADLEAGQEWTGWHRIEKALWVTGNTVGLDATADKLVADVTDLRGRVATAELTATGIANGAKELLDEVSSGKITGEEDIFSHTDLVDFAANVAGAKRAFQVLEPIVSASDPALTATLTSQFAAVEASLAPFRTATGYVSYDTVTEDQRKAFAQVVDGLSEPLSKLAAAVA